MENLQLKNKLLFLSLGIMAGSRVVGDAVPGIHDGYFPTLYFEALPGRGYRHVSSNRKDGQSVR
jgi:hypothetical protein